MNEYDAVGIEIAVKKVAMLFVITRINLLTNPVIYFESTKIHYRPVKFFCECHYLVDARRHPLSLYFQMSTLRRLKADRNDATKLPNTIFSIRKFSREGGSKVTQWCRVHHVPATLRPPGRRKVSTIRA